MLVRKSLWLQLESTLKESTRLSALRVPRMVTYTVYETRMDCYASWNSYLLGKWSRVFCNVHGSHKCSARSQNHSTGVSADTIITKECNWPKPMARKTSKLMKSLYWRRAKPETFSKMAIIWHFPRAFKPLSLFIAITSAHDLMNFWFSLISV